MMIRTALLAATAAVAFTISPALASGPTVLTDAELDSVVAGTTIIILRQAADDAARPEVLADIVSVLDNAIGCDTAPRDGRCGLPLDAPAAAEILNPDDGLFVIRFADPDVPI